MTDVFCFSAIFHDQAMLQKCPENRLGDGVFGWDDIKDWVLKIQLSSCCCFVFLCVFFPQEHPYFADSPSGNLFVWRLVPTQIGFGVSLLCCKDGIVERLVRPPYIPTGECPCDGVPQVCWHCCTEIRCCEDVWSLHYDLSGRKSARTNGGGRRPLHELVLCW